MAMPVSPDPVTSGDTPGAGAGSGTNPPRPLPFEMRTAILRTKADELGVNMPPDVIEYIAHRDQTNIRELEGALNKILMTAQLYNRRLNLALAMESLTDGITSQTLKSYPVVGTRL